MKPAKTKRQSGFRRDAPDLPAEPECNAEPARLFADPASVSIEETLLQDVRQANLRTDMFRLDGCVLERVQLAGAQCGAAVWKDVRLVGCDLANVRAHRMALMRVEFIDCRLTGFRATTLDWQDVLVRNGDMSYSQLQAGKFRNCEFDACNWQDADLQEADLGGSVFRGCNFAQADLRGAKLENTDFRKSEVAGMFVGMGDLRGAIVDPAQAMIFARLLGLRIV